MKSWIASGLVASVAWGGPVMAQPVPAQGAPVVEPERQGIEDIVVTARRREEALQNVPVAITALSGSDLESKTLRQVDDLKNFVPSVNVVGLKRDNSDFYIRGQGPGSLVTGQRNFSSVATYFAEVPTTIGGPGVFYDLANVQVLKGPQGTLFGRNTTGGAVLFEPNAPTWDDEGYAQVQLGNYDFRQFNGVVNIAPVADKVALRLATEITRRDGFTRSINTGQKLDNRHYEGFRGSLRLAPVEGVNSTTIVNYRNRDQSGTSQVLRTFNPSAPLSSVTIPTLPVIPGLGSLNTVLNLPAGGQIPVRVGGAVAVGCTRAALPGCPTGPFGASLAALAAAYNGGDFANGAGGLYLVAPTTAFNAVLATQAQIGPRRNQQTLIGVDQSREWSVTNRTTAEVTDTITLKNVISYQKTRQQFQYDFDGTPLQILDSIRSPERWALGSEQFTEEFQVQGRIPAINVEYIAGVYYEHEEPGFDQLNPGVQLGNLSYRIFNHRDTSRAVFGHLEWNPTDYLSFAGGVRRTRDGRRSSVSVTTPAGVCTQTDPATGTINCPIEYSASFRATTYDGTVSLKPVKGLLTYASYRRGYKSGGFNLPAPAAPAPLPADAYQRYNPEYVNEVEIGVKGDFRLGTVPLRFDLAYFHDDYRNIQVSQQIILETSTGPQGAVVVFNNVNAETDGFEASVTIIPFRGFNLSGFMSYVDAAPTNTIVGAAIAGRQLRNTPKWKYGLSPAYQLPLPASVGEVTVSADFSHQSRVFPENNASSLIPFDPGYGLLNLRLQWNGVMATNIDVAAFVTNVADKLYLIGGYPVSQLGFQAGVYGEPRMYGGSIKYRF